MGFDNTDTLAAEVVHRLGEQIRGKPFPPSFRNDLEIEKASSGNATGGGHWLHVPKECCRQNGRVASAKVVATQADASGEGCLPPVAAVGLVDGRELRGAADRHLHAIDWRTEADERSPCHDDPFVLEKPQRLKAVLHRQRRIQNAREVGTAVEAQVKATERRAAAGKHRRGPVLMQIPAGALHQACGNQASLLMRGNDEHHNRAGGAVERRPLEIGAEARVGEAKDGAVGVVVDGHDQAMAVEVWL